MDDTSTKRGSFGKLKKKKKITNRDASAPRQPLSAYFRFSNDRREKLRADNPNATYPEIIKMLGNEWNQLSPSRKENYQTAAEADRLRYIEEMNAYKLTKAYRQFNERKQQSKGMKRNTNYNMNEEPSMAIPSVPIFTEEFLKYNEAKEAELRQLRKSNADLEQQNAILEKHTENMEQAIEKFKLENVKRRNSNAILLQHLQKVRASFLKHFASIPLPDTNETPSEAGIDQYVIRLHTLIQEPENADLLNEVQKVVRNMDLTFS